MVCFAQNKKMGRHLSHYEDKNLKLYGNYTHSKNRLMSVLSRVSWFFKDIRQGINSGYPVCCTLEFAIEHLVKGRQYIPQRSNRRIKEGNLIMDFVPCHLHLFFFRNRVVENNNLKQGMESGLVPESAIDCLINNTRTREEIKELLAKG